ncbi:type I-E CRISPR-associated protein Cas5/CasD [Methylosinus sp. KRF6]|uniref:type I-E CRISPR-associated protein Cas5/CasD n=1 Tax=Methylosinus sp. KRF6 TaxID=2846853 RepID=UPI001C0D0C27|nr:type I-E CRISPR-associated protein Cas5/CasD [Methylosinus sp. KRF6]MBU3890989.1 type I-E CRISPR-associated protein Cas5/CasD [Methylosinus sp. KRF6]
MQKLLLFQLVAPLGSFGGVAVGERRETGVRPSHSALAGLLGAALGLERADPRQADFAAGLAFASRRDRLGPLIADYHTAQTPPARKGKTWATRRDELAGERNTILSRRDYRADCAFTIACGALEQSLFPLDTLAEALQKPAFTLYLGRKSCPLGLPPDPLLVEVEALEDAFVDYDRRRKRPEDYAHYFERGGEIAFDDYFTGLARGSAARVEMRRDVVLDRELWSFDLRDEHVVTAIGDAAP